MEYKNVQDNRYRTSFMRSTEALMDKLTVKEFVAYLEKNAEQGESTCEYVDGTVTDCKTYILEEEYSNPRKEFLVTVDGRLFYWRTLMEKIELIDAEEPEPEQKSSTGSMTTEKKITVLSGMDAEELLKCFGHYAGKNILEMTEEECESYMLVKTEILERMN